MNKRISDKEIIDKFVNSYEFPVIDNYISKPYEETIIELDNEIKEQGKEIERLNNVINELEKYTIEQINIVKENMQIIGNEGKRMATRFVVYNEYLDKLKALKEDANKYLKEKEIKYE